jgi:aldose 1-epimerase
MDRPVNDGRVVLHAGDTSATVDLAAGGRLASLVVDGRELLVQHGRDVFHWGSFPMAPWVGRLRHGRLAVDGEIVQLPVNAPPHALHGLVTERAWQLISADGRTVELAVELGRESADPWPWRCRIVQTVALAEDRIDVTLAVHTERPMPADIGWHPWFVRELPTDDGPVSVQWDVDGGQVYLNDADGLPSGELGPPPPSPWDYCFTGLTRPPTVRWPGLLELTVDSDCDHWVLYDEEQPGVCVEPWTGPPNSLNGNPRRVVHPDQPLRAWMSWAWRPLGSQS